MQSGCAVRSVLSLQCRQQVAVEEDMIFYHPHQGVLFRLEFRREWRCITKCRQQSSRMLDTQVVHLVTPPTPSPSQRPLPRALGNQRDHPLGPKLGRRRSAKQCLPTPAWAVGLLPLAFLIAGHWHRKCLELVALTSEISVLCTSARR